MSSNKIARTGRSFLATILVAIVLAAGLMFHGQSTEPVNAQTLQAAGPLKWYRGNLHTHSLWSDGDDYLEAIALWYREHNYDFLGFTDHNVLADKERWIDVEKSKGKQQAFDKLKQKFPNGWVEERMSDGKLETRLKMFREVADRFNEPGKIGRAHV